MPPVISTEESLEERRELSLQHTDLLLSGRMCYRRKLLRRNKTLYSFWCIGIVQFILSRDLCNSPNESSSQARKLKFNNQGRYVHVICFQKVWRLRPASASSVTCHFTLNRLLLPETWSPGWVWVTFVTHLNTHTTVQWLHIFVDSRHLFELNIIVISSDRKSWTERRLNCAHEQIIVS